MEDIKQSKFFLAPEERAALLEAKYERARAQVEAMIAQIEAVKKIVDHLQKIDLQSGCRQRGPVSHYN
jgi:hypothetical protein